jgi:hypothetical protein
LSNNFIAARGVRLHLEAHMSNEQVIAYLQTIRNREEAKKRFMELTEIVNEVGKRMTE